MISIQEDEKMTTKENGCEEYTQKVDGLYFKHEGTSVTKIGNCIYVNGPDILLEINVEDKTFGFCEYEG